jgi:ferric iron reductase protein FhuF
MSSEQATRMMTPPVMRAWFALSSSEENIDAVNRHYHVPVAESGLPPTRLLAEWREAGHPDPHDWIREKVEAIVQEGTA